MLSVVGPPLTTCEGKTRREWLRVGGLAALGLSLPQLLRLRASGAELLERSGRTGRARSCILMFLFGGPAHQDTWDPKPDAPSETRGEFRPIQTAVPGIQVSEHLPELAKLAEHYAIVRSVSHPDNTHTVAMHYMLTGARHLAPNTNPRNQPSDFPTYGSVLNYLRPAAGPMPRAVSLNAPANQVSAGNFIFPGFFAGFLGAAYDPLFVAQDPSEPGFRAFPVEEEPGRLARRETLRARLGSTLDSMEQAASVRRLDRYYEQALDLLCSAAARRACDLDREPPALRDRYGRTAFGQGLLLARRLVEAGVSLVTVNWARDDAFWDTHKDNFRDLKTKLLPPFDTAFSALVEDLAQRRLLDDTLLVCLSEFGRTPKINANAGRDHWAPCFSVVLAGAGIRGGQVYGASDRIAAYPAASPVSPEDLAATIYSALSVDPSAVIRDPLGRPHPLCSGRVLNALY